jgi:peptide chain release factor
MSVHLLMSAERGPQECAWALARLLHRLEAHATVETLTISRVQTVPGERPDTYRPVLVRISGDGAEAFAALWTGTLCWQAPSPYRANSGRQNWYVIARPCQVGTPRTRFAETNVEGRRLPHRRAWRSTPEQGQHGRTGDPVPAEISSGLVRQRADTRVGGRRGDRGDVCVAGRVGGDRWSVRAAVPVAGVGDAWCARWVLCVPTAP